MKDRRRMGIPVPKLHSCICYALIALLSLFLINYSSSLAAITDCQPTDWSAFTSITTVNGTNGNPIIDAEGSDDASSGGATATGHQSFASNCKATGTVAVSGCSLSNCNPALPSGRGCGLQPSFYFDCATVGTVDVLFFRLRIDENPREGSKKALLENGKWNILIDIDEGGSTGFDGFKEFWILVDGNTDTMRVLYENGNPPSQGADPAIHTLDTYRACADEDSTNTTCSATCGDRSFTRSIEIPNSIGANNKNEYWLDIMVPETVFSLAGQTIDCNSQLRLFATTSNSNTNPLQKDLISPCTDVNMDGQVSVDEPCFFSQNVPVTLAYFDSYNNGKDFVIEWSTDSETGNAGFNIYYATSIGLERLNKSIIASKSVNSTVPLHYKFITENFSTDTLYLTDVDIFGREIFHGPFKIDNSYGRKPETDIIDWKSINFEHENKKSQRVIISRSEALKKFNSISIGENISSNFTVTRDITYPKAKLSLVKGGIYRVSYEDLAQAGLDYFDVGIENFALTNKGVPVPIYVFSPTDKFGPGSYIEFYGNSLDSIYTDINVYILSVDQNLATRVQLISDSPSGKSPDEYTESLSVNNNRIYNFSSPVPNDPWIDLRLFAQPTSPVSHTYEFDLKDISAPNGFLNLNFWGLTNFPENPDHHIIFELNGTKILDEIFDGFMVFNTDIDLNKKGVNLKEFSNQLKITLPGDTGVAADIVNFNSFNVQYSRNFVATGGILTFEEKGSSFMVHQLTSPDIIIYKTNGTEVFRHSLVDINVSNGFYNARFAGDSKQIFKYTVFEEGSILKPDVEVFSEDNSVNSGTAEYLIISHPDFVEDISELVNERSKDFSTKLVTSDVIYDNYNFGVFDPQPIKDYIKYAYENLGTEYVLLVGGDSYDYKNYLGLGALSFIPTIYFSLDNNVNFAPSDSLLADTDGDYTQDLAIGRLPARTSSELSNIIDKILEYPVIASGKNAVFAADDAEGDNSFSSQTDGLIDLLPEGWNVDRAYIDDLGVDGARELLTSSINDGRALTSFFGHSGFTVWTFDGLFNTQDAASLTNEGRPTIVTQLGCWNTYFVDPIANTLSHKFLLSGKNGAAAVAGPTSLTEADSDRIIGGLILEKMFTGYPIGKALMEAKQEISSNNQFRIDIIAGWNLLGDPALSFLP